MIKKLKAFLMNDPSFFIYAFVSICFYALLVFFILLSFFTKAQVNRNMLQTFDFNNFAMYFMLLGVAYVTANLGETYLSNPKKFEVDESGKVLRTSGRKKIVWVLWSIFFALNVYLYIKVILSKIDMPNFKIVEIAGEYVIISIFVMGGETLQNVLALLPSPIAKILSNQAQQTPPTTTKNQ